MLKKKSVKFHNIFENLQLHINLNIFLKLDAQKQLGEAVNFNHYCNSHMIVSQVPKN